MSEPKGLYITTDDRDPTKHNYFKKVMELSKLDAVKKGHSTISIHHDEWCKIYKGKYCNCDPDVELKANLLMN